MAFTHSQDLLRTNHAFLNDIAHHAAPSIVDLDHNPGAKTAQVVIGH